MSVPAVPAPIRRTWLAVLLVGLLVAISGALLGYTAVRGFFTAPPLSTPGTVTEHAHAGEYLLYVQSGTKHSALGISTSDTYDPQVRASAFSVTEDSAPLALSRYDGDATQTQQRGSRLYTAVATVHVPHSGRLTLRVTDAEGAVILGPSVTGTAGRVVPGAVVGVLGVLLVGSALVIRSRALARVRPQWRLGPEGYAYRPPGWEPPVAPPGPPAGSALSGYPPPPGQGSHQPRA